MSVDLAPAGGYARRRAMTQALRAVAVIVLIVCALVALLLLRLPFGVAVGIEALLIAALWAVDRSATPVVERWARGASGEEQVGAVLAGMETDGWRAVHDIDLGRGNVDHVAIGPGGVFAIETKARRGFVDPDKVPAQWWKQAYAEAKAIERIIGGPVEPVLVVSGGYTKQAYARRRGVLMCSQRVLAGHLGRRTPVLGAAEIDELHQRLATAVSGSRSR